MKKIGLFLYTIVCLGLTGCSTWMPNGYGQQVIVVGGQYVNMTGRLLKDCSGFENYQVQLNRTNEKVCIHVWNLERIYW